MSRGAGCPDAPPTGTNDPTISSDLVVTNAPAVFELDVGDTNINGFNFDVSGVGGSETTLTLVVNGAHAGANFASLNYDTVDINTTASSNFFTSSVTAVASAGDTETINVSLATGVSFNLGNVLVTPAMVGHDTLSLFGGTVSSIVDGTLNASGSGDLFVGVTNAAIIDYPGTGALLMFGPDDAILYGTTPPAGDNVASNGVASILQGTLGTLSAVAAAGGDWTGVVGDDSLTDAAGLSAFFGDGGADTITLGGGNNSIQFGLIQIGTYGSFHGQAITDNTDAAYQGFWGIANGSGPASISTLASTSADMTTVTGFTLLNTVTSAYDILNFNTGAWGGGVYGIGALVNDNGQLAGTAGSGTSTEQLITTVGQTIAANTDVVLYDIGTGVTNAAALAAALSGSGNISFTHALLAHSHMLFAYSSTGGDIKIADVDFVNGVTTTTAGQTIVASDMVDISHSNVTLVGLSNNPLDIEFSYTKG